MVVRIGFRKPADAASRVLLVHPMEPTLPEDCVILVDHNPKRRLKKHIFVVRKIDGLVVKRAGKDNSGKWRH